MSDNSSEPLVLDSPLPESPPYPLERLERISLLSLSQRLSALMLEKDKLSTELANELGIEESTITEILAGQAKNVTLGQLTAISRTFGLLLAFHFLLPKPRPPAT